MSRPVWRVPPYERAHAGVILARIVVLTVSVAIVAAIIIKVVS